MVKKKLNTSKLTCTSFFTTRLYTELNKKVINLKYKYITSVKSQLVLTQFLSFDP